MSSDPGGDHSLGVNVRTNGRSRRRRPPRRPPGRHVLADGLAGGSVALVLIPQALAYAEIAGVPAHIGLYASALPLIAAAFFASSPYLQTGPTALTALFTLGALTPIAEIGTREYILLASLLALLVGVIRLGLGIVRLGSFAYVMSEPVVLGFTTGGAILILSSQVPTMLGVSGTGGILANALDALWTPDEWQLEAVVVSAVAVTLVLLGRRLHPLFPGVLVVVAGGVVWSRITGYDGRIVGDIPHRLLDPSLDLPWGRVWSLLVPAFVDRPRRVRRAGGDRCEPSPPRIASHGMRAATSRPRESPTSCRDSRVRSRSAAPSDAARSIGWPGRAPDGRARSPVSSCSPRLPLAFLFEPLPRAVLGAIVAVVIFRLIRLVAIARLWAISPLQMLIATGTLIATLATAPRVERGVLIGIALSVVTHLYREMNLSLVAVGDGSRVVIAPRGVLWFGTAHKLEGIVVNAIADHDDVAALEIDLTGIGRLDYTGAEELRSLCSDIEAGGVAVSIVGVPAHARRIAGKTLTRWWRAAPPSDSET